jgi:hypothetical protein
VHLVQEANINTVITEDFFYSSSFLPRKPSAFQQTHRKAFPPFVLRRIAILNYEKDGGFGQLTDELHPL